MFFHVAHQWTSSGLSPDNTSNFAVLLRVSPSLGHLPEPLSPRCLGSQRNSVCLTHTIKRQGLSS